MQSCIGGVGIKNRNARGEHWKRTRLEEASEASWNIRDERNERMRRESRISFRKRNDLAGRREETVNGTGRLNKDAAKSETANNIPQEESGGEISRLPTSVNDSYSRY